MPDAPRLIAEAPNAKARSAREDGARRLAAAVVVPFESACALYEKAPTFVAKLAIADTRWIFTLRCLAEAAHIARGANAAATGLYHRRARELDDAARELAAALGAKAGTPLHAAIAHILAHPPGLEACLDA